MQQKIAQNDNYKESYGQNIKQRSNKLKMKN